MVKLSNPSKKIDAVVLEFDDPMSRIALRQYAKVVMENGFYELGVDIITKCDSYDLAAYSREDREETYTKKDGHGRY